MRTIHIKYAILSVFALVCLGWCSYSLCHKTTTKSIDTVTNNKVDIEKRIAEFNDNGPYLLGDSSTIISNVSIEDGFFVLYCEYQDYEINVLTKDEDATRALFYLNWVCMDSKQKSILMEFIKDNSLRGLKYVLTDENKNVVVCEISNGYLSEMDKLTNTSTWKKRLRNGFALLVEMDTGSNAKLIGNNLIIPLILEEDSKEYSFFKEASIMGYKDVIDTDDSDIRQLIEKCSIAGCNIIYRVIGEKTKNTFDIIIPCSYLKQLVKH